MQFRNRSFDTAPVALRIENLSVRTASDRESVAILDQIDVTIREGETVCLVGESGSGKSVTSLAVMGLLPKDALEVAGGRIELDGKNLLDLDASAMRKLRASRISMIFQEPMTALNPVMKVGAQIEEVLDSHTRLPSREKKKRVIDIMNQVHLPDVERIYGSYPHQLSGGQRQRIMIAMALILEPKLLIADEPTTALDVTTQNQVLKLIAELQERHGTAVLFITHDMGVVAEIADTVYVMRQGKIVESAPIETLLRTPREDYTRNLLQSVPSLIPREARSQSDAAPVLDVDGLTKIYDTRGFFGRGRETRAAQDVRFAIRPGRTLGIVGESGSGKSTVARCIMRLIDPTDGRITVGGADIAKLGRTALRPHRKQIQIVFQDPFRSLNPRWTVGESLIEGPLNFGETRSAAMKHAGRRPQTLPAPVFRRPAPAHRHRPCDRDAS
jgi:peptide/nickel transport system ATP-binding protein